MYFFLLYAGDENVLVILEIARVTFNLRQFDL
jgi:hypothetical protein